ncbi:MAG: hypothetical protein AAF526_10830 [Pseudomonadota bacterium]
MKLFRLRACLLPVATLALLVSAGHGQAFNDPDWPCVQRKVLGLSIGQMWTAQLPPENANWRVDAEIADLAPYLAARRTDLNDAEVRIKDLDWSTDRNERLTLLFAGIFEIIERDRRRIINGITKYAQKQRALSEQIDATQASIAIDRTAIAEDDYDALDALEEREDKMIWDTRIYQERNKSLIYVCESPVILEKRVFALARMIQDQIAP